MSVPTSIEPPRKFEEHVPYRALSKSAVLALVLGILSLLALLFPALLLLPLAGLLFGVVSLMNIRRYPKELTGKRAAILGTALSVVLLAGGATVHTVIYLTEVPEGYQRISFDELQPDSGSRFPIFPERALELHGKMIFVKGYVHPGVSGQGDIQQFVLVPDMGTCCFGGQPKLTDMIEVQLSDPHRISYNQRKRKLAGVFSVDTRTKKVSGGLTGGLYRLEADYVK